MRKQQQRNNSKTTVIGRVKRNQDGFGFLIPDRIIGKPDFPDVYLPRFTMKGVMTDDRVSVACEKERDGRYSDEILEIVQRAATQIVGKFKKDNIYGGGIIEDDSKAWGQSLRIEPQHMKTA